MGESTFLVAVSDFASAREHQLKNYHEKPIFETTYTPLENIIVSVKIQVSNSTLKNKFQPLTTTIIIIIIII
jgi:hypothetical protein